MWTTQILTQLTTFWIVTAVRRKIWVGEKLMNLTNCEPFAKFSLPIFTDTQKTYMAYMR